LTEKEVLGIILLRNKLFVFFFFILHSIDGDAPIKDMKNCIRNPAFI